MAVNRSKTNVGYGITNPLQNLSPQPIVSDRAPTTHDTAELGTLWINKATDAYYVATSISAGATNWEAQSTGAGTFAAVTVTGGAGTVLTVNAGGDVEIVAGDLAVTAGDVTIGGDLDVTGDVAITGDFDITDTESVSITSTKDAAKAIYLHANGGTSETIEVHSDQGTGLNSLNIHSDVGGILIEAVGKANAGAINLVADAGGVKIDAALNSVMTVTGAGQDIDLNAIGGSIHLTSTEAVADAINLTASDAAGGIALVGTGGISLATTNAAATLTTGTGAINLGTDAVAKTITIGNVTGATAVNINTGTGGAAVTTTGTGDIVLNSADTCLIDSAGVLELNSSAGVIGIGNDAVAQNINIGTGAAARVVTIGNATGASGVAINCGTAGVSVGTSATNHITTVGSTTAGSTLVLQTPAATQVSAANGIAITTAAAHITLPGPVNIMSGAGVPANGLAVNIGDMYIRTDAGAAAERIYIATAASTWTNVTCAA